MPEFPYTVDEQIRTMREDWPDFRVLRDHQHDVARWRGPLTPRSRRYKVEIIYGLQFAIDGPIVRVLSPTLTRLPDNPEGSLPHVYFRDTDPQLCLFDPAERGWSGWELISKTIVPWTSDWLTCYEFWLMTGVWHGGGRHPPSTGRRFHAESRT